MTPSIKKKRRQMIEGTQVLWSTLIYAPVIIFAICIMNIIGPVIEPYEQMSNPVPKGFLIGLGVFFVIGAPLMLHYQVWRPLRKLALDCGSPELFWDHCKRVAILALPYAPLVAIPIVSLCFYFGGWFMLVQIAAIIGAEHMIEKWRQRPIEDSVDTLLQGHI